LEDGIVARCGVGWRRWRNLGGGGEENFSVQIERDRECRVVEHEGCGSGVFFYLLKTFF